MVGRILSYYFKSWSTTIYVKTMTEKQRGKSVLGTEVPDSLAEPKGKSY